MHNKQTKNKISFKVVIDHASFKIILTHFLTVILIFYILDTPI